MPLEWFFLNLRMIPCRKLGHSQLMDYINGWNEQLTDYVLERNENRFF